MKGETMKALDDYLPLTEPIDFGLLRDAFLQSGWTYRNGARHYIPSAEQLAAMVSHLKQSIADKPTECVRSGGFWVDSETVCIHRGIMSHYLLIANERKATR